LTAGILDLWVVLVQFKREVESGRFLPPELRAEIKQKVELTPQEKEILKKVIYHNVSSRSSRGWRAGGQNEGKSGAHTTGEGYS
jgi:hypothetical protein